MREGGGDCLKYLKRGWNRKEVRDNKDFKKGVQAGSRGGCLKKRGAGTPLRIMDYKINVPSYRNQSIDLNCKRMGGIYMSKILVLYRS